MPLDFGYIRRGNIEGIRAQIESTDGEEKLTLVNTPITMAKLLPLYLAAYFHQTELVKFLLENGASIDDDESDKTNKSTLTFATEAGYTDIVDILQNHIKLRDSTLSDSDKISCKVLGDITD